MTRVHLRPVIFASALCAGVFALQGCTTAQLASRDASGGQTKIIHFADSMGAVYVGGDASSPDDAKLRAMLAAFEQCDVGHQLAYVTQPIEFSPSADYSFLSSYALQHGRFLADSARSQKPAFVAPFECIDQKHGVATAVLESREVPGSGIPTRLNDEKGAVKALAVEPNITGLKNGDLILAIGDKRVETRTELAKIVDWLPVGPTKYTIIRANAVIQVDGEVTDRTPSTLKTAKVLLSEICSRLRSNAKVCGDSATIANR